MHLTRGCEITQLKNLQHRIHVREFRVQTSKIATFVGLLKSNRECAKVFSRCKQVSVQLRLWKNIKSQRSLLITTLLCYSLQSFPLIT